MLDRLRLIKELSLEVSNIKKALIKKCDFKLLHRLESLEKEIEIQSAYLILENDN